MWRECNNCHDKTNHRIKYLGGEKESYYESKCGKCGYISYVQSYVIADEKIRIKQEGVK
jgi:hypothetical protein